MWVIVILVILHLYSIFWGIVLNTFLYIFGWLECFGHSFAYVAHFYLRDVWIRTTELPQLLELDIRFIKTTKSQLCLSEASLTRKLSPKSVPFGKYHYYSHIKIYMIFFKMAKIYIANVESWVQAYRAPGKIPDLLIRSGCPLLSPPSRHRHSTHAFKATDMPKRSNASVIPCTLYIPYLMSIRAHRIYFPDVNYG